MIKLVVKKCVFVTLWNYFVESEAHTGFTRAKWELGNSRAREKREGGMMGTSVEREGRVMSPLSLIINSNIPSDRERLGTRQTSQSQDQVVSENIFLFYYLESILYLQLRETAFRQNHKQEWVTRSRQSYLVSR